MTWDINRAKLSSMLLRPFIQTRVTEIIVRRDVTSWEPPNGFDNTHLCLCLFIRSRPRRSKIGDQRRVFDGWGMLW